MLNAMARLPRRIASELTAKLRSYEVAAVVAGIESGLTKRRRDSKMESGSSAAFTWWSIAASSPTTSRRSGCG